MKGGPRRRIVVVRHGVTDHNVQGLWQGQLDIELNADGIAQAEAAAPHVAAYDPSVVVSSDLARARRTAEAIAGRAGLEVRLDPRLREIDCGLWQGLGLDEVARRWPGTREALAAGEDVRRGETGENLAELAVRVREAVDDLLGELPEGRTAVVVTHGVSARTLVAELAGLDQSAAWRALVGLENAAWAVVAEFGDRWRIEAWNAQAPAGPDAAPVMSAY